MDAVAPTLPIIAASRVGLHEKSVRKLGYGQVKFLRKLFEPEAFLQAVEEATAGVA